MADYGFSLNVTGNVVSQMTQIENSVKKTTSTIKTEGGAIANTFTSIGHAAEEMKGYIAGAFAAHEIYAFGQELMHLTAEFQGFENVIKYSSFGIVDAATNTSYLENAIERLHLPMKEATEAFSEMQAGFFGTGIEGDKLRKVFEGVSTAASVLHLNPASFSRVTFALKEIGELGTLQARQLRMLSFALPGAGNLAADAMGMSSAALHEAMKKGEVSSSVFLPKFADALQKHFESGLENAGQSLISQINDEKNSVMELMLDMGNKLTPLFSDILKTVGDGMRSLKGVWDSLTSNDTFVNSLKFIFDWAVKLVPIWAGYKVIMMGYNGILAISATIEALFTREVVANTAATWANYGAMSAARVQVGGFGTSMVTAGVATETTTGAMVGLNSLISSFAIGALVVGIGLVIEKFIDWNGEIDKAVEGMTHISEISSAAKQNGDISTKINTTYSNLGNLDSTQKSELYTDIQSQIKNVNDALKKTAQPQLESSKKSLSEYDAASKAAALAFLKSGMGGDYSNTSETTKKFEGLQEAVTQNTAIVGQYSKALKDLQTKKAALDALGIKPYIPGKSEGGEGGSSLKDGAVTTSNLAGANGGLGQAKQINIYIQGPIQQNNGVKESKEKAGESVEQLIRAINNIADSSQNSM